MVAILPVISKTQFSVLSPKKLILYNVHQSPFCLLFIVCMSVLTACVYGTMCLLRPEEGTESNRSAFEPPCGFSERAASAPHL